MWELLYIAMVIYLIGQVIYERIGEPIINQQDYYPIN